MGEITRVPSPTQIQEARNKFKGKSYREARGVVQDCFADPVDLRHFRHSESTGKRRVLSAADIFVNASIRLANMQTSAASVARELGEAKRVIHQFVDVASIRDKARELRTDSDGNNHVLEMRKAKIAFTLTLVLLTRNPLLLSDAIAVLKEWIDQEQDVMGKSLLVFDRERLKHRRDRTDRSFDSLTTAYTTAEHQRRSVGRWQEAAMISARYIFEVGEDEKRRNRREMAIALGLYNQAIAGQTEASDFLELERRNRAQEKQKADVWRSTSQRGVDYSSLALSRK